METITKQEFKDNFRDYKVEIKGVRLPDFKVDDYYKGKFKIDTDLSNFEFLKFLTYNGLKEKKITDLKYKERADYELSVIDELGFVDYILLVWDIINFCHEKDIPVGAGRGSAAGSCVLFLIGATQIDSIKYDLYFERFISKTRAKKKIIDGVTYLDGSLMCDVDIDIGFDRRHEVIEYLQEKFKNRTCGIANLTTLQGKILMKECCKIVGDFSENDCKSVANKIPKIFGKVKDIEECYKDEKPFREWANKYPKIYQTALRLRGLIKNKSIHASGMVLSYDELDSSFPIEYNANEGKLISSYSMEFGGLVNVKLDLLGLRALTVVDRTCKALNIKMSEIDINDPFIYQQFQNLKHPQGLFQIEAPASCETCQQIKPKNLEELSGVMAIARPGAMEFTEQYANFTNTGTVTSIHPFFDDILSKTGGLCLFQEQLMQMVNKLGFTLEESETVRRIVGKKKIEEVKIWKGKIDEKIKQRNLDPAIGDVLWKILEDSANYSFNKSHSIAYANLTAITTYLKFKYPLQYYLYLLQSTRHESKPIEEISKIQKELSDFGIKLLRPHLLKSELDFSIDGNNIRFGLLSIKGISDKSIEKLAKFKTTFSNKFEIFRGAEEAGLNVSVLSALIQAGTLDNESDHTTRSKKVLEAQLWGILTTTEKQAVMGLSEEYNFDLLKIVRVLKDKTNDKNKPIIKEKRYGTIKKKLEPYGEIYKQNNKHVDFANWYYEYKLLGYCPNISLTNIFHDKSKNLTQIKDIHELDSRDRVAFVGIITEANTGLSINKNKMHKMTIQDETGIIKVFLMDSVREDKIENCRLANGKLPREGNIVMVWGQKGNGDAVFADSVKIECLKIFTKLGDYRQKQKEEAKAVEATKQQKQIDTDEES